MGKALGLVVLTCPPHDNLCYVKDEETSVILDDATEIFGAGRFSFQKDGRTIRATPRADIPGGTYEWVPAAPPAGASQQLVARFQDLQQQQDQLQQRVGDVEVFSKLFAVMFEYSEGNVTAVSIPAFKALLMNNYSKEIRTSQGQLVFCMVLGEYLPKSYVIAAHIYKKAWSRATFLLGFNDINDVRNGLLLFKPVEWAFDTSRLFFLKEGDDFVLHILDPNLEARSVVDVWLEVELGRGNMVDPDIISEVRCTLREQKFGDLEGFRLRSDAGMDPNPFERALWFHAHMATRRARKEGWIQELPQIPETSFVGYDKYMIARFFASMDVE